MNIILFGPPGVGKSTLIGVLKTLGARAIDLEDVYPSKIRFALPNSLDNAFIGAADLSPARKYTNAVKVLLYLDQESYDERRAARDAAIPSKSHQAPHHIDDWLKASYDVVLQVKGQPRTVARKLLSIGKERGGFTYGK